MSSSVKIRAALCAVLMSACSSGPEVVATQRQKDAPSTDASTPLNLTLVSKCEPGQYHGEFTTDVADSGLQLQLNGPISFSLVQLPNGPEKILSLANDSELKGSSSALSATFTATIQGGSECRNGSFETQIVDGQFFIGGSSPVYFEGTVNGHYFSDQHTFTGYWNVFLNHTSAQTGGTWIALLVP
jgi:hypothetical protein